MNRSCKSAINQESLASDWLPSRREWLAGLGCGFGTLALSSMLAAESTSAVENQVEVAANGRKLDFKPKAKRVIQLFMAGAASHIDLFDYKPDLIKHHGKPADFGEPIEAFQDGLGPWKQPVWQFKQYGQCGKHLSDVVADLGVCADDMAFIHNMVGKSGVHSTATLLQTTGFTLPGFPGMGCWASYGLGSETENLPAFVVLPDHRGFASNGVKNWDAAFLPSQHSGTIVFPNRDVPIEDLYPHASQQFVTQQSNSSTEKVLASLNSKHAQLHPLDSRLESRIRTYELAARMQLAAPEALDISKEPKHILEMYGIEEAGKQWPSEINAAEEMDHFGRKCLVARRLIERGVRFVQVWSGNDNGFPRCNWIRTKTSSVITARLREVWLVAPRH